MRAGLTATMAGLALASASGSTARPPKACSFAGDIVNVSFFSPDSAHKFHDAGSFVVPSSGIDPAGYKYAEIELEPDSIVIRYKSRQTFETAQFDGYILTDLSRQDIASVTIDGATTVAGVTAANLTVRSGSIALNLEGLSYTPGQQIRLDVLFACGPPAIARLGSASTP